MPLERLLETVVTAQRRYPGLALLIFDFKEHNAELQALLILRNHVRAALSGSVPFIISINKFEKFVLVENSSGWGGLPLWHRVKELRSTRKIVQRMSTAASGP
ncbi:MAG: hypothetical protein HC774_03280 [Sphingomonadales bacterium]|nr:hypothetical protein [Sphingomonadales bacterium]